MSSRPWTVRLAVVLALLVAVTGLGSSVWWLVLAGQRPGAPVLGLTHHLGVLFLMARLAVAVVELLLAVGVWRGIAVARTVQMVWSGVVAASALLTATGHGGRAGVTGVVTLVGSAAVLVLLWLLPSRAWFRGRSVRPARAPR